MWFVYIIENKLGHLYTGICKDLAKRVQEHCSGGVKCAKALKGKGPLTLQFSCQVADHSSALKLEIWIKKLSKPNKLRFIQTQLDCPFAYQPVPVSSCAPFVKES